jgi:ribosomal subunit interface protein
MTVKIQSIGDRVVTRNLNRNLKYNGLFEIIIRANGVDLTDRVRDAVVRKIGRVRKYAPKAYRARVHLEREHMKAAVDRFRVTVRYEIPGHDLVAEHRAHEPMAALDLVSEKIERRLRKRKTARLASRVGRRGRPCRIADFCGLHELSSHKEGSHVQA